MSLRRPAGPPIRLALATVVLGLAACQTGSVDPRVGDRAATEKIAVIDIQSVFERSKSGRDALNALMAEFGEHRRRLLEEEAALKETARGLEGERQSAPTRKVREQTERYLVRLEQYRVQVQAFNQDLAKRHRALVAAYLPKIVAVAKPLAEREGYSTVLHQGRPETVMIVFYHAPEIDLTDRVIEALDRASNP